MGLGHEAVSGTRHVVVEPDEGSGESLVIGSVHRREQHGEILARLPAKHFILLPALYELCLGIPGNRAISTKLPSSCFGDTQGRKGYGIKYLFECLKVDDPHITNK